eukprot:CAMPEP_0185189918 /NCGR_PEP_ID=MMETSP1140-20130426/6322_1 /TAXON_ID=298111 /ORGANISM="Pavlova sp., Strain CCMP459" /LENGTH=124 /DNA_ID=CAMNT_0027756509 /DNA_START=1053 /DNA_END=1423 /DNA_ORIENTATION=+
MPRARAAARSCSEYAERPCGRHCLAPSLWNLLQSSSQSTLKDAPETSSPSGGETSSPSLLPEFAASSTAQRTTLLGMARAESMVRGSTPAVFAAGTPARSPTARARRMTMRVRVVSKEQESGRR